MARQTRLAALVVCGVFAAGAQDLFTEARTLNNVAAALYADGQFDAAERTYRAALSLSAPDPVLAATVASNLGALYKRLNRYTEAEQRYREALALRRKHLPSIRPEIADSMNNLAEVYRLEGRYWQARDLSQAAVEALDLADSASPDMPVFLNNWAGVERDLHHLARAEELLRRAQTLAERSGQAGASSLALVMNTSAQVLADQHRYEDAALLFQRAGAFFESARDQSRRALVVTLANLGRMQALLGRTEEAAQTERRALALLAGEPRPDQLLRAAILHNLGNVAAAEGNALEALACFEQSLAAQQRILGWQHPSNAAVLLDYAAAEFRAGARSQARKLRKRAEQLLARRKHDDLSRYTVDASAFVH